MNNMQLKQHAEKVLQKDKRLWTKAGELDQTLLLELLEKTDSTIIALLLAEKVLRDKFFVKISPHPAQDGYVFKMNDFRFFMEENKTDNSYTQYKNRIGLTDGKRFLKDSNDVVLDFPFKDCVLEGGQSSEEGTDVYFEYDETATQGSSKTYNKKQSKRKEIFFNTILAQDEIDRLFDQKAFVNWTRYTNTKEYNMLRGGVLTLKRAPDGTLKENLIIRGNNLIALHSLKQQFAGKIKLIYIDPPYNTGNDGFKYNDNFNHSTWLTFMKNRLEVAKTLLRDDGVIFVQSDDNEQAYLKVLMDEVFGRENFVSTIAYQRSGVAGLGQGGKFVVNITEYINILAKDYSLFKAFKLESGVPLELKHMKRYNGILKNEGKKELFQEFKSKSTGEPVKIYKHNGFKIDKIPLANFQNNKNEILKTYIEYFDAIFRLNIPQKENSFQHHIISSFEDDGLYSVEYLVSRGKNKGKVVTNHYYKNQLFAWLKSSAKKENDGIIKTNKMSDFWTNEEIPKADLANEGGVTLGRGKKPEQLLKRIIQISTQPNDIVLDYHLGSGTTAAVAHKMGRQYIGIEQMDYIEDIAVERLKKVIDGEQGGISKSVGWQGGGEFLYCEIAQWNEKAKARILEQKDFASLKGFFQELYETYFLSYNLKTKEFVEKTIEEENFAKLTLDEQKAIFIAMLDNNQMYVNKSEMADEKFSISQEDQELTAQFYNEGQ